MSIQRRLIVGLGLMGLTLWGGAACALYLTLRAGLIAEFDQALRANAQGLATLAENSGGVIKFDPAGDLMPAFERRERPDYFELWLPDGSRLARSRSLRKGSLPRRGGSLDQPECWNLTLPDGERGRAAGVRFAPAADDENPPPPSRANDEVVLVMARHRADLDRRLTRLATTLIVVGILAATVGALLAALLVRRGLKPLSRLAGEVAAIDASTLQRRVGTDSMPSELLPIGRRLNDLLARLESSFARERRFSDDVAHELRTPIAELRALSEVALKWPDDDEANRHAIQEALGVALQMESIATRLLALARCEGGLLPVNTAPVPLGPLIQELWKPLAEQAAAKNLAVDLGALDGACWNTDPVALRTILTNLLSNAVEHSPAAGAVLVRFAETKARGGRLVISNTTDDLEPGDLPHLFERFWRKDGARSSSIHCGLGLALSKAYAGALGLHLTATMTRPGELTIELASR